MQGDEVAEKTVFSDAWKLFFEVFVDSLNSVASEGEKLITCQAFSKALVPHSYMATERQSLCDLHKAQV